MLQFIRQYRISTTLALVSLGLSMVAAIQSPKMVWEFAVPEIISYGSEPMFETIYDMTLSEGAAHAPAIIVGKDGFSLIWFQGSREGGRDVAIVQSDFTGAGGVWNSSDITPLLTTADLSSVSSPKQAVVVLGNTIQYGDQPDRFLATVLSIGGWAMASIADVRMQDGGPVSVAKLNLSPFLNRSHLVKSPTLEFTDGDIALPAYFEIKSGFGEFIRIGANGRVVDKRRMTWQHSSIQPMVVAFDALNAVALLRNFSPDSDRLIASWTNDGGQTWREDTLHDIPNPSAPVAAVLLANGDLLMAFNDSANRGDLFALAASSDQGHTWRRIAILEDHGGEPGNATRYPMMRRLAGGEILLVYSHSSKTGIRAHVFNDEWVAAQ